MSMKDKTSPPDKQESCDRCKVKLEVKEYIGVKMTVCSSYRGLKNALRLCHPCGDIQREEDNERVRIWTIQQNKERYAVRLAKEVENIPRRFKSASTGDFADAFKPQSEKWIASDEWAATLAGPPGTGKTHAAFAMALLYCEIEGKKDSPAYDTFVFITVPELLAELRHDAVADSAGEATEKYKTIDGILVMDDLGAEKSSEYALSELYRIISYREMHILKTIITTNLGVSELSTKLHDRIASRLTSGRIINFKGKDRRTDK